MPTPRDPTKGTPAEPPLETPTHGRGKLLRGGKPGHKGGSGRRPNKLRAELRANLEVALRKLRARLTHPRHVWDDKDLISAIRTLAEFGIGKIDTTKVRGTGPNGELEHRQVIIIGPAPGGGGT